mmetsp:Transcript_11736/g.35346  ORF Transcript_11736/g.35346 Transcript_11736/m.35346 type:complete len:90 (-) Transcript_11736:44-313(-)
MDLTNKAYWLPTQSLLPQIELLAKVPQNLSQKLRIHFSERMLAIKTVGKETVRRERPRFRQTNGQRFLTLSESETRYSSSTACSLADII